MRNITRASIALIGAVALTGVTAMSATAATDPTVATVAVAGGDLSISAPDTLALASTGPGVDATAELTPIVVTDARASTTAWVASILVTDFTSDNTSAPVIEASALSYTAGEALVAGEGIATVDAAETAVVGDPTTAATVQTASAVNGNHTATWLATLVLTVPGNALAESYVGTVTNQVL
jgi:hypothetical protein